MKVPLRIDRRLIKRLEALGDDDRARVLAEAVSLVTDELNNGVRHQIQRVVTDVEESVGIAFEDAVWHNRSIRDVATDRVLRTILAREELGSR